jgi:hypothetical protein
LKVVLARIEDAWQLAMLVEWVDATHAAVFVPGAPDPKSGSVYRLTNGACEKIGAPAVVLHMLGLALFAGRLVHAAGISRESEVFAFRVVGMALTFTCYVTGAIFVLAHSMRGA